MVCLWVKTDFPARATVLSHAIDTQSLAEFFIAVIPENRYVSVNGAYGPSQTDVDLTDSWHFVSVGALNVLCRAVVSALCGPCTRAISSFCVNPNYGRHLFGRSGDHIRCVDRTVQPRWSVFCRQLSICFRSGIHWMDRLAGCHERRFELD